MREADKLEGDSLGKAAHKLLYYSYKTAVYRRTGFVDGEVAAMWGVSGTPFGIVGMPYLITSSRVEKLSSFQFARIYKQEVEVMADYFPILENYVDASYEGAIRMLKIAGFNIQDKVVFNGRDFYRFDMVTE